METDRQKLALKDSSAFVAAQDNTGGSDGLISLPLPQVDHWR